MKNNYTFPLSFDDISRLLGKNDEINADLNGVVMVKKSSIKNLNDAVRDLVFKSVLDEWQSDRGVVVGKDKLLTQVKVLGVEVKEQSLAINNYVVMSIRAQVLIQQDPAYAKELKEEKKLNKIKHKV